VASGFSPQTDLPTDSYGENLANRVYATTNKQTYNLPLGASMKSIESKQELSFAEFYSANFDIVCAVCGYPPEVILSKYNSNYSASRAAIKDFEHTIIVQRQGFSEQFYQTIYNFCLDCWVLENYVNLNGYEVALMNQNTMALYAYRYANWQGDVVPHIDPIKEVNAWRLKLGKDSENMPLCTVADAIEALAPLGGTDFNSTLEQYAKEIKKGEALGIEKVLPKGSTLEDGAAGIPTTTTKKPAKKATKANKSDFETTAKSILNGTI
jgi:capsid protein